MFSTPMPWAVGLIAIVGCIYLFMSLPTITKQFFAVWMLVGLAVYFLYARYKSALAAS